MNRCQTIILILIIIAIASFFRLWHLNSIPPGLYPDEAMNGNNAIEAIKTSEYKVFYPENNGREGLFINLQALSLKIFGVHVWALRLVSAIIGILTVLGLYFLTLELFNSQTIALLSSFFLATSFWHVNFSRIGFRAIMVPLLLVWSFYLIFKAINDTENSSPLKRRTVLRKVVCCLLSGFIFGLGFHTYIAFRIAPLLLIIPIIIIILRFLKEYKSTGKFWSTYIKNFLQYDLWILAIIITALPIGLYFLNNPQDFIGRASGISIFFQENLLKSLVVSMIKTLGMFNIAGDFNWRHNFAGSPQLFWPVGIFFIIGLVFSIKKIIKSLKTKSPHSLLIYSLLITWFIVMLLPAILTYEGIPHALRAIGVIPVAYIFAGLGAYISYELLYKFVKSKKLNKFLLLVACCLLLVAIGYAQFDKYFVDWTKQPDVKNAFAKNYVDIGNYLNTLPAETISYVIVNQPGVLVKNIPVPAQTVMFIENSKLKIKNSNYLLPEEIDEIEAINNFVVIPLQYDREIFRKLREKFPEGKIRFQENFWLFEK